MTGRAEVSRLRQQLDATFERVKGVDFDSELQADYAKYLCILVSGYIERAVIELVLEHTRLCAPTLLRFVEQRTRRLPNMNSYHIQELLGSFDLEWREKIDDILVDEWKDAVDSIVNLRNNIAHGRSIGATYHTVSGYYQRVKHVIDEVANICVPEQ